MSESWDTVTAYGNVDMTLHPVLRRAYRVACLIERCGASPELTAASSAAFDLCGEIAAAIESLQARVAAAEDALASDPVLTDKDLCAAVIVCVMSGEQARRDEACLKLQRHISAVERERDCLETECEHLSDRAHMAEHELSARRSENDVLRAKLEAAEMHKAAKAAIDFELGIPEDGCNNTQATLTAIRLLHSAHRDDVGANNRLVAFLSESVRMIEGYMRAGWLTNPAAREQATDFIQRARLAYSAPPALPENK